MNDEIRMTNDRMTKRDAARQAPDFGLRASGFVIPAARREFNRRNTEAGTVLIIVMVVCIGLVSVALFFAHSAAMSYRGSTSDISGRQAQRAIDGAVQYAEYLMIVSGTTNSGSSTPATTSASTSGSTPMTYLLPDPTTYQCDAVPVGDATFWFIGEPGTTTATGSNGGTGSNIPSYGLVDEASKLNLNTASATMLEQLPNMTTQLAQAIVAWRTSGTSSSGSSSSASSSATSTSGSTKGGPFESIYELAQVVQEDGDDPSILYGNDTNLNHVLDSSESQGQGAGEYTPGLYEYVTVFSREPNIIPNTTMSRINVTTGSAAVSASSMGITETNNNTGATSSGSAPTTLRALLTAVLGQSRSEQIERRLDGGAGGGGLNFRVQGGGSGVTIMAAPAPPKSVLEFYIRGQLTPAELDELTPYLTMNTGHYKSGLINVNTASATVLACVPGITPTLASQIVSARATQTTPYTNLSFLVPILGNSAAIQAGPYLTTESFQVTADVAAVGPGGNGYRRTLFVIDGSNGAPQIVYRHDMTPLGWALGPEALQEVNQLKATTK